ncbi:metal-dependent transcriptional regulator [Tardisphaera miroshnichenkoae]
MQPEITIEDYLLAMYELLESHGEARLSEMAQILEIAPSSVDEKLAKMTASGLVRKNKRGAFELTDEGMQRALKIVRKHRLAELLLTDILGMPWAEAHEESRVLEHAIDDKIGDLIEKKVSARYCPHGNPIPDKEGRVAQLEDLPISKLHGSARVTRITFEEFDTLYMAEALGLKPGALIFVEQGPEGVRVRQKDESGREREFRVSRDLADVVRAMPLESDL